MLDAFVATDEESNLSRMTTEYGGRTRDERRGVGFEDTDDDTIWHRRRRRAAAAAAAAVVTNNDNNNNNDNERMLLTLL